MKFIEKLCFDDVMLVPQHSEIISRSAISTSVSFTDSNKSFTFEHPLIPANMKTIVSPRLVSENRMLGGLTILHRFQSLEDQLATFRTKLDSRHIGFSLGVKEEDRAFAQILYKAGARIFCIDIAHGDCKACIDMIHYVRSIAPDALLIAGNIATGEAAMRLWQAGADFVKASVGGGSICLTRIETGNGVPLFSSLVDIAETKAYHPLPGKIQGIIADGGIRTAGDCVKSLCLADMVMCGNLFAGCQETPGQEEIHNGVSYKAYHGSSTHKSNHVEGVKALVKTKGKFKDILKSTLEGIRSGCSYQGVDNLSSLKENPEFCRITSAGKHESGAHDVLVIK